MERRSIDKPKMIRALLSGGAIGAFLMSPSVQALQPTVIAASATPAATTKQAISLANGKKFTLSLPKDWQIRVAVQGLKRVRFMAQSPDQRIFVTDMFDLTDNQKGTIYSLDRFDAKTGQFGKVTPYLKNLRNPNSVAFYVEPSGKKWLYIALTDRLIRYRYQDGDLVPKDAPQVLAKFPDYGLSYKYGGWHLTRTLAITDQKVYVSVGSSCNSCEEKEAVRASIVAMDFDGSHPQPFAQGLRNAVGIKWVNQHLFATNMGSDHLGDNQPAETFYRLKPQQHYGFPYCFEDRGKIYADPQYKNAAKRIPCNTVPVADATFAAHSAPLGLEYFAAAALRDSFLIALHGGSKRSLKRGYAVMQVKLGQTPTPFITGFLQSDTTVNGRPVDILRVGADAFLLTDDYNGVIYYVFKSNPTAASISR